jgi:hypothetical protein
MNPLKTPQGWIGSCRGYSCKQHRENNGDCDSCPIDASD